MVILKQTTFAMNKYFSTNGTLKYLEVYVDVHYSDKNDLHDIKLIHMFFIMYFQLQRHDCKLCSYIHTHITLIYSKNESTVTSSLLNS